MGKFLYTEAAAQRCSAKKVFLEILQNSQENTILVNFLKFAQVRFGHI